MDTWETGSENRPGQVAQVDSGRSKLPTLWMTLRDPNLKDNTQELRKIIKLPIAKKYLRKWSYRIAGTGDFCQRYSKHRKCSIVFMSLFLKKGFSPNFSDLEINIFLCLKKHTEHTQPMKILVRLWVCFFLRNTNSAWVKCQEQGKSFPKQIFSNSKKVEVGEAIYSFYRYLSHLCNSRWESCWMVWSYRPTTVMV